MVIPRQLLQRCPSCYSNFANFWYNLLILTQKFCSNVFILTFSGVNSPVLRCSPNSSTLLRCAMTATPSTMTRDTCHGWNTTWTGVTPSNCSNRVEMWVYVKCELHFSTNRLKNSVIFFISPIFRCALRRVTLCFPYSAALRWRNARPKGFSVFWALTTERRECHSRLMWCWAGRGRCTSRRARAQCDRWTRKKLLGKHAKRVANGDMTI